MAGGGGERHPTGNVIGMASVGSAKEIERNGATRTCPLLFRVLELWGFVEPTSTAPS